MRDRERLEDFERVALPHLPSVAFLAERLCGGPGADADDLAQETVLRAWASFDRLRPGSDAKAWMLTIALNAFRDRARKRGRDPLSLETLGAEPALPAPEPVSLEIGDARLRQALDALPPSSRAILTLAVIEGVSCAEIARSWGIPEGTIRSLLSRAKAGLRRALDPGSRPSS